MGSQIRHVPGLNSGQENVKHVSEGVMRLPSHLPIADNYEQSLNEQSSDGTQMLG